MSIRLASFDMAGTTIAEQGTVYAVLRSTVEDATGRSIGDELISKWGGTSKHAAIGGLLTELDEDVSRQDALFEVFTASLAEAYAKNPPTLVPGVREAVAQLRAAGVAVALQTGYSREVAESLLDTVGWAVGRDVDALVTSDEVPASRPAPFLVFGTMQATGVTSVDDVLVAGDTANDLRAGVSAGVRYIVGVATGAYSPLQLGRHRHTHLLESVAAIPALLVADDELGD